ncbi:UdgX family uracil-DNA binding protein [Pimelobacter simplex]|uniref:Type-4 uracil-DNA glycosylase n=1 Tax=Nocardioides simplex TaxID=2045 RepID=A0A0A1DJA4_NOCSI|nr:UdgX family uracil-DNA binding protein [Pimelobacter simplex]AIY16648.1 Uracil-DNA glycosylase, putative family 6 [Pimelobacter simplex]MCG8154069.1 UdgX family uracil-DNA binding protein [Pimelobacter simplex]GEB15475.1 uracil-DNA glycosylase [Pimelobacter simplex]SFN15611.1 DNA polymerase [Pimelobacter simplex]
MASRRPGAEEWVPARPSLRTLRSAVQECRGCELYRDATQGVMGDGARRAGLVLLGEQPGDQEDQQGEPFVGPAGRVLDEALADADLAATDVFRTNVVKHFRWSGTRGKRRIHQSPNKGHVEACRPWLRAELALVRPRGVVVLGSTAGQALYGPQFRVGESRGRALPWPDDLDLAHPPAWAVATTHPSAVLRARDERQAAYDALVADLRVAVRLLGA